VTPLREPQSLLVTGGAGFIGSSFIRYVLGLADFRGTVTNFDSLTYAGNLENLAAVSGDARYSFVRGDILDGELVARVVRERKIDALVHFAAESHVDRSIHGPDVFVQTNVVGTFRLLEVVRQQPHVHFHHVSTDEVYGSLGPTGAFTELTPYQPSSPYSASKAASDHLVRAHAHTYGLGVTLSNCSNNYGPYQFPEKLIPLMIANVLAGRPLPVYGNGTNVRDWLYVDDHAEAVWSILRHGRRGETYNVGGESEWQNIALVRKLIAVVAELSGKDTAVLEALITYVADRPGHDQRYAIDCSKLKSELGWRPRHDLEGGLHDTVRWYMENQDWVEHVQTGAYRDWLQKNYAER
jgi:dTDP-glucose 4,6-dehydratase